MPSIFGPSLSPIASEPGSYFVTRPSAPWAHASAYDGVDDTFDPLVEWCRNASAVLHRDKQIVTEEMQRAINLYRGGTPWWRHRPKWKIGTTMNFCATVPIQWAAILSDNKPRVTYSAHRMEDQRVADIATAAFDDMWRDTNGQQKMRNAILGSRIQKKYFLRLTYDPLANRGEGGPCVTVVTGEQVFVDENATCIDDAEVILYEFPQSPNKIFSKYPHLKEKIMRKRSENRGYENNDNGSILSPATTQNLPTGDIINNPPYAANANPPDNAGGTSGITVREFWTRPRATTKVSEILFLASGEPATQPKMVEYEDGSTEPLRRVRTEGNIVYEWPQEFLDIAREMEPMGGLRILDDTEALECVEHKVSYPLYPDGRLIVIVDEEFKAEDRMNPYGYIPLVEISAYPDPVKFWGTSDIDLIADVYEYWVRLWGILFDNANLTSNTVWRLPIGSEMSDEDITNAPGSIQREDLVTLKFGKREPAPDMPSYVIKLLEYSEGKIKELSGLNEISSGTAKFKGQQSSETVSMYQEAAGVRFNDALHGIEQASVRLGEQFLELMTRFYTTPRIVQIKNEQAQIQEPIPYIGSMFVAPMKVEAKPGSSRTPTQKLNSLLNLMNTGKPIVDLPEIWEQLQEMGLIRSSTAMQRRIVSNLRDPSKSWLVTGQLPGGAPNASTPKKGGSKRASSQGK
jgi:hypothetical protein